MNIGNMDIDINEQSVTLRMRHLVRGHPGCVLAWSEVKLLADRLDSMYSVATAKGLTAPASDSQDFRDGPVRAWDHVNGEPEMVATGTKCSVCGEPQFDTPSGACCTNGHGGSPAADPFADLDLGPEEEDPFSLL